MTVHCHSEVSANRRGQKDLVSMTELGITGTLNINDLPFTEDRTRVAGTAGGRRGGEFWRRGRAHQRRGRRVRGQAT